MCGRKWSPHPEEIGIRKEEHAGDQCKTARLQVTQRGVTRVVEKRHTIGSCADANVLSLSMSLYLSLSLSFFLILREGELFAEL